MFVLTLYDISIFTTIERFISILVLNVYYREPSHGSMKLYLCGNRLTKMMHIKVIFKI